MKNTEKMQGLGISVSEMYFKVSFICGHIPELEVAQKIPTEKTHPATTNRDWQKEERVFSEFSDHKCGEVSF